MKPENLLLLEPTGDVVIDFPFCISNSIKDVLALFKFESDAKTVLNSLSTTQKQIWSINKTVDVLEFL